MLVAGKIAKTYPNGVEALSDISLSIESGEILGLVGINGAGKTTFVKIAVGVLEKDQGTISVVNSIPIKSQKELSQKIAWIPQDGSRKLSTWLSGRNNILYYCMMRGLSKKYINQRIDELVDTISPERDFIDKQISVMSGGQMQLCNIFIGLVPESSMLFCDEISVSLDPTVTSNIYDYLKEYVEKGKSVLLTSQNLAEVETLSDRVALLHGGKIVEIGRPRTISKKLLEYEIIDIKFDEKFNRITKFDEFFSELQELDDGIADKSSNKTIRLRCSHAYDIVSNLITLLKKYSYSPLIEVGKPNLQDALKRLEQEEEK